MKLFNTDKLLETLTGYLETKLEIFKLDLKVEIAATITKVTIYVILGLLGLICMLFLLMALAAFLNEYLESSYLGYLIDAGILVLIGCILYFNKNKIGEAIWDRIDEDDQVLNIEDEE